MKGRQALIDIGVVLAIPLLFFVGGYFWSPTGDSALLSLGAPPESAKDLGANVKAALDTLRTIDLEKNALLFDDPVYQSLQEFHVDIAPATLGRDNPFTPPDAVRTIIAGKLR